MNSVGETVDPKVVRSKAGYGRALASEWLRKVCFRAGRAIAVLLLLVWAPLDFATVAHAQPQDVAKADVLFREARALMKAGDFDTACPKLEESYRLDPAAGTAVNLGDCFDKIGKVGSALLAYQAARQVLQAGDPRISPVEKQISVLKGRAPKLTVVLAPGAPEGTKVERDGKEVGLGVAAPMNPGRIEVVVTAPGREPASFSVTLAEGESKSLTVKAPAAEETAGGAGKTTHRSPTPDQSPAADSSQSTLGFILGGAGVVALGAALFLKLKADANYDEAGCSSKCPPNAGPTAEQADSQIATATWAAGFGALAVAGGVALVLTAPSPDKPATSIRVAPGVTARGPGVVIGGVW